jgi:hypothetical protein
MFYTLDRAVSVTGLSKLTILDAMERSDISDTQHLFGEWQIEHRELCNICPALAESADEDEVSASTACNAATLETEIATFGKDAGDSLREQPGGHQRKTEQLDFHLPAADPREAAHWLKVRAPDDCDSAVPIDCDQAFRLIATTCSRRSRPACGRR